MKYWWEEKELPRSEEERDQLVLWWQSYVLLAREGRLRSYPLTPVVKREPLSELQVAERLRLVTALDAAGWQVKRAARALGITTRVCHYKMNAYELVAEYHKRNGWAGKVGRKARTRKNTQSIVDVPVMRM